MNCTCHCNVKCKLLGGLEQKIMDVLWSSSEPLKPSDVLKNLKDKYAYTTIMTVLKRMADKKLVKRVAVANAFIYSPTKDRATFAADSLNDLFTRIFASYGDHAVAAFKKTASESGISL